LKYNSTVVQTTQYYTIAPSGVATIGGGFSLCSVITGLSGSVTFSVTATAQTTSLNSTAYGNLVVLEF
jgi:hypothetical protein